MKDLIIITTRSTYLPSDPPSSKGLFSKPDNCSEQKASALSAVPFLEPRKLWRLKETEQFVFATTCLENREKNNPETLFKFGQKCAFVKAIFSDVAACLNTEEKAAIGRIFLFAHGFDLDWSGGFATIGPYDTHELLEETTWLEGLFPGKKFTSWKPGEDSADGKMTVFFTAFSHVPNVLFQLLETGKEIYHNQEFKKQLPSLAEDLRGWNMEKKRMEQYQSDGELQDLPRSFNLNFYYSDISGWTDSPPKDFPFGEILKDLKAKNAGESEEALNIVFFPLSEISESADNRFSEKQSFYHKAVGDLHKNPNDARPTIFISFSNIVKLGSSAKVGAVNLDPRFKFLDSSIWYRYVPIEGGFNKNLQEVLKTIAWAYKNRLYFKNVCFEFLEFQNRLIQNSYLDNAYGSGHARQVFPFTFHSETAMEEKASGKKEGIIHALTGDATKLRWNFLLVDDFANECLKEGKEKEGPAIKKEIVRRLIESPPAHHMKAESNIAKSFDCAKTVDEALPMLGCEMKKANRGASSSEPSKAVAQEENNKAYRVYDIILLDYLFSDTEPQHYGTKLLEKIECADRHDGVGVLQSYWIYPISVFNEAIQSDLQEKGYQYLEKYWHLARGADPLNTPHLFRRTLYEFMQAQAGKILFKEKDLWQFMAENPLSEPEKLQNSNAQFKTSRNVLSREKAIQAFRRFIERFSMDEGLPSGSALAESVLQQLADLKTRDLRDHIRQLLYLLGFSVGFDFPVIEREFRAIEDAFEQFRPHLEGEIEKEKNIADKNSEAEDLLAAIENAMKDLSIAIYSISGKYF